MSIQTLKKYIKKPLNLINEILVKYPNGENNIFYGNLCKGQQREFTINLVQLFRNEVITKTGLNVVKVLEKPALVGFSELPASSAQLSGVQGNGVLAEHFADSNSGRHEYK